MAWSTQGATLTCLTAINSPVSVLSPKKTRPNEPAPSSWPRCHEIGRGGGAAPNPLPWPTAPETPAPNESLRSTCPIAPPLPSPCARPLLPPPVDTGGEPPSSPTWCRAEEVVACVAMYSLASASSSSSSSDCSGDRRVVMDSDDGVGSAGCCRRWHSRPAAQLAVLHLLTTLGLPAGFGFMTGTTRLALAASGAV